MLQSISPHTLTDTDKAAVIQCLAAVIICAYDDNDTHIMLAAATTSRQHAGVSAAHTACLANARMVPHCGGSQDLCFTCKAMLQ